MSADGSGGGAITFVDSGGACAGILSITNQFSMRLVQTIAVTEVVNASLNPKNWSNLLELMP